MDKIEKQNQEKIVVDDNMCDVYPTDANIETNVKKLTFIQEKIHYQLQLAFDKIQKIDEKLNMMLVFNAALFILLTVVLPIQVDDLLLRKVVISFLLLFGASEAVTVGVILVALFPKKYLGVDIKEYTSTELYDDDLQKIYEKEIEWDLNSTHNLQQIISKKSVKVTVSIILSLLNIVLILILVVLEAYFSYV